MNSSGGGTSHTLKASSPTHQYSSTKRNQNSTSTTDLRDLTTTLHELNNNFKRNIKVLTEIKDYITKVCEKQDSRLVDDNSGVHKLDRVRFSYLFFKNKSQ
ncbi:unnamed protein product [Adineta steineri]|uniref:Uncharacterized protein n=1 Tax=Adineta steineri TaxID=433720 RepID=A0A815J6K2_9BILA|nr:unnamed protein product [Adineta steineri]CAF0872180.1 unnamed protein product [Adineta steineri]CAF1286556.1 unnamed protein product [Adineta steineri]CAF1375178.1 unnamed protein product [Adineta steineri]CAF1567307.1 unnamed protein product [Adineta steineri]